jgi:predicted acylesterase/phospholipase RssA
MRVLGERARAGSLPGERRDGFRVALAIEGGGMRGTISAGMALALDELGLVPAFDVVYGASAGAITGAWLLSRPQGLRGWTEPAYARAFIRRSALLRGHPVADIRALIEELYQTTFPMDFDAVLASPVEFHPLATDAATGQSTDLRPFCGTPAELRLALRASAALPLLAGPPVQLDGRRFYDAGLSESVPYRTALAQGATHVLVLRSRRGPVGVPEGGRGPARSARVIARTALRREPPALRAAFLGRDARLADDDRRLAEYQSAPPPEPPATPQPSAPPGAAPQPPRATRRCPAGRSGNTRIRGPSGGVLYPASGWLPRGKPPSHRRAPAPGRVRVRPRRHSRRFLPFHLIAPAPEKSLPKRPTYHDRERSLVCPD